MYKVAASVQLEIFKDRIEIINPGRLHPSLTIQDLYRKHESCPPNARIAHAFYQVKYIEALGTGITDLLKRCREVGLKRPLFEETSGRFKIVLWRPSIGNKLEIIMTKLIEQIRNNPKCSVSEYARRIGCENKDVKKVIARLQNADMLHHEGAKKNGIWKLLALTD